MLKKLIALVVVVAVAGGAAFWWFVLRPDEPETLSLDDPTTQTTGSGGSGAPDELDGTWKIPAKGSTTAGFRIKETFGNGAIDHVAVGRSSEVTGSIEMAGSKVTEGAFVVDLTALEFTDAPPFPVANRIGALRSRGLETSTFPTASFDLTKPIDLGGEPVDGKTVTTSVTGDLTIHGVTKSVTFDVEARLLGDTIQVATKEPVVVMLEDFAIRAPTGGPVASVDPKGSFEFKVLFTKR